MSGTLPPLLVEAGVGLLLAFLLALARLAFVPWTGDAAPFALVFVSVIGATVLAGWRAGLVALIAGQAMVWFAVVGGDPLQPVPPRSQAGGLVLATAAQLVALVIIALYQREIDRTSAQREAQLSLMQKALAEIDHRTNNNYQTVLALVRAQARRAHDPAVTGALQQVGDRIEAIANASRWLAVSSDSLDEVRARDHLRQLCAEIERGLTSADLKIESEIADVSLRPEKAGFLAILLNELVTNAIKHGFPDDRPGTIRVGLEPHDDGLMFTVADNGVGVRAGKASRGTGLGMRLVETFVRHLHANHEMQSDESGTRHFIRMPC